MAANNSEINQELYKYLNDRYHGNIELVDDHYVCTNDYETAYIPADYLDPNYSGEINVYAYMTGDSGGGSNTANQYAQQEIGLGDCAYFISNSCYNQVDGHDVITSATNFATAGNYDIRVLLADSFSAGGGRMAEALSNKTEALDEVGHPEVALIWEDAYESCDAYSIDKDKVYDELAKYGVKFYGVRYNKGGSERSNGTMPDPLDGYKTIASYLGNGVLIETDNRSHGNSNGDLGRGGKLDESYNNGLQRFIMMLNPNLGGTYNLSGEQIPSNYQFSGWNPDDHDFNLYLNPENIRLNNLTKEDIANLSFSVSSNKSFNYSTFEYGDILTNNQEAVIGYMNSLVGIINSMETLNVTGIFDPTGLMAIASQIIARYNAIVEKLMRNLYIYAQFIANTAKKISDIDNSAAQEAEGLIPPAIAVPDGGMNLPRNNGSQQPPITGKRYPHNSRKSPYTGGDAKDQPVQDGSTNGEVPPASETAPSPNPAPKAPPTSPSSPSEETANKAPDPIIIQAFSGEQNQQTTVAEQENSNTLNFRRGDGSSLYADMENGHLANVKFIYHMDELLDEKSNLESIKRMYGNVDYVKDIVISNNNIEVILKEDAYANLTTFDELIAKYKLSINYAQF